ncbi:MAG: hypothetical protein RIS09_1260 [Actinomycetota bacterium]
MVWLIGVLLLALLTPVQAVTFPDKQKVKPVEAPWVVSFWSVDSDFDRVQGGFFCTGALIDPYTVITAAHCMAQIQENPRYVMVRNQTNKYQYGQVLIPRSFRTGNYDSETYKNDIAIIDLYHPVILNSYLKLPSKDQAKRMLKSGSVLYGWGDRQEGKSSNYLRKATLQDKTEIAIASYSDFFPKLQLGAHRRNSNGTYSSACYGDSGGPLVGRLHSSYFLVGVVSYGAKSKCESSVPSVFTRISAYRKFINSMKSELLVERQVLGVEISGLQYRNTAKLPMPTSTIQLSPTLQARQYVATLTRELSIAGAFDVASFRVRSFSANQESREVSIALLTRDLLSANTQNIQCAWGETILNAGAQSGYVTLMIRDATDWFAAVQLKLSLPAGGCLLPNGSTMQASVLQGTILTGTCSAKAVINAEGLFEISLNRACLPNPKATQLRLVWATNKAADLEPGPDLWIGPLDLEQP